MRKQDIDMLVHALANVRTFVSEMYFAPAGLCTADGLSLATYVRQRKVPPAPSFCASDLSIASAVLGSQSSS